MKLEIFDGVVECSTCGVLNEQGLFRLGTRTWVCAECLLLSAALAAKDPVLGDLVIEAVKIGKHLTVNGHEEDD